MTGRDTIGAGLPTPEKPWSKVYDEPRNLGRFGAAFVGLRRAQEPSGNVYDGRETLVEGLRRRGTLVASGQVYVGSWNVGRFKGRFGGAMVGLRRVDEYWSLPRSL